MIERKLKVLILERPKYRAYCASLGAFLNTIAVKLFGYSRSCVRFMNHHVTHPESDWFVHGLSSLQLTIKDILARQKAEYGKYYYFYGQPYQSLAILGVYGERATEERFEAYGIRDLIGPNDHVLDIGCNCGFVALYTAFRTGCRADGIDINPYMIEIGTACAEYLRVSDKVNLHASRIQDFVPEHQYTVLFSFATHWTDDKNYRVPLREHFERCANYLAPSGLLVFETHAADVGNAEFYSALEEMDDIFTLKSKRDTDQGTRHLYLFYKKATT
jgi:SAM-dependent methyltransferase